MSLVYTIEMILGYQNWQNYVSNGWVHPSLSEICAVNIGEKGLQISANCAYVSTCMQTYVCTNIWKKKLEFDLLKPLSHVAITKVMSRTSIHLRKLQSIMWSPVNENNNFLLKFWQEKVDLKSICRSEIVTFYTVTRN